MRPATQAQIRKMRHLKSQRATFAAISAQVGVSACTVWRYTADLPNGRGSRQRVPDYLIKAMRRMKSEGKKIPEIAKAVGYTNPTIIFHTRDVPSPWHYPPIAEDTKEAIRDMRRQGLTYEAICDKSGVSRKTVRKLVKDIPVPAGRKKADQQAAHRAERDARIMLHLDQGVSVIESAAICGCSVNTVARVRYQQRRKARGL